MCGRYVMSKATGDLLSYFDAKEVEGTPPPSWNVAPTQDVPIVAERLDEGSIERHLLADWASQTAVYPPSTGMAAAVM